MKTKITTILCIVFAMIGMLIANPTQGQTTIYQTIYWDDYSVFQDVPYCPCDSIKCLPPYGATLDHWFAAGQPETYRGDTLILKSGINAQVSCYYGNNNEVKSLRLRPLALPILPNFSTEYTVCGVATIDLDAENHNQYGFNSYYWSNESISQTITVGEGIYTVTVENICGTISYSTTITEFNPNSPNLGTDLTVCKGTSVVLDPGTDYSEYLWLPGSSTDTTLSPTTSGSYIVQTTNAIDGCVDRDTVQIIFLDPPMQEIDLVTIDTTNGNNRITWTNIYEEAVTMNIYRKLTSNNYILVGTSLYDNETWTDTIDSKNQTWTYKIAIVDSCNNEGTKSSYVKSIHTWVTQMGNSYTIQWTPYEVEAKSAVSQYNIYHGSQLSELNYLTFVDGDVTVYTLYNFTDSLYVIGAQLNTKGTCDDALSNWIEKADALGIDEYNLNDLITIYPTLTTGPVTITTDLIIKEIKIYSSLGQVLLITKEKEFIIPNYGLYFLHITTDQGMMIQKIMVK